MKILAFDTAMQVCSAALADGHIMLAQRHETRQRGHAEALMPMLEDVRAEAGMTWPELDAICVTIGPGTFTGVRIGLAAARGLALVTGVPVIGVTTLEAIAAEAVVSGDTGPAFVVCIDARRGQVYTQTYSLTGSDRFQADDRPAVSDPADVAAGLTDGLTVIGSGAHLVEAHAVDLPAGAGFLSHPSQPDARSMIRLACDRGAGSMADAPPAPLYLRPPDAKPPAAPK